jgi:hypothetical protein
VQDAIRSTYAISYVVAILAFVATGYWRRFPACMGYLCAAAILAFSYAPETYSWHATWYLALSPLCLFLRFASAVEVLWKQSAKISHVRWYFLVGITLAAVAVTAGIWDFEPADAVFNFVQLRRYAQIATVVFAVAGALILWAKGLWVLDAVGVHSLILLVLLTKQAVYSALSSRGLWGGLKPWLAADWPGLLITSLCCLSWAVVAVVTAGPFARRSRSGHQLNPSAG